MNGEYLKVSEKWSKYCRAVRYSDFNLADEQLVRALEYSSTQPLIAPVLDDLRKENAYTVFEPDNWLEKELKGGTDLSILERDGLSERLKVLDWVSWNYKERKDPMLWRLGQKIYSGSDSRLQIRVEKALDFFFLPIADYVDFELRSRVSSIGEEPNSPLPFPSNILENENKSRNVFVVHGRNMQAKEELEKFLRAIDLHPIEWAEARKLTRKPSPFTHEIVYTAFQHARAIVVLLCPEDIAYLHLKYVNEDDPKEEKSPMGQPRQNVLFELGMAMGRDEERTVLVQFGGLRKFSDLEGRHIIRINNSPEKRKELAQRLETAGCQISLVGDAWLKAGNFSKDFYEINVDPSASHDLVKIDKDEESLLVLIARREDEGINLFDLENELKVSHTRARYLVDELGRRKFIITQTIPIKGDVFRLTQFGRKYAIENKLVS